MSGPGTEKRFFLDTRRRWSPEEKRSLVAETRASPVSRVARQHGIAPSLLFRWRKEFGGFEPTRGDQASHGFLPVALAVAERPSPPAADDARAAGIEIIIGRGHRIVVGRDFDAGVLKRVIAVLEMS